MLTEHEPSAYDVQMMTSSKTARKTPAQDPYLAFALRWWWLLLIGLVLGSSAAVAYNKYGPQKYQTVALIQVAQQTATSPYGQSSQARDATSNYVAEVSSSQVMQLVSRALAGKLSLSARDLQLMNQQGGIDIRSIAQSNFITITVTDTDPARARLIANTYAQVATDEVNQHAGDQVTANKQQLQQQIDATRQRLVTAQLLQRRSDLEQNLQTERTTLLQLQTNYQQELTRQQQPTTGGGQQQASPQLTQVQDQWLQLISDQVKDIQNSIAATEAQLKTVNDQLAKQSTPADPEVSAAFASAYQAQLTSLTQSYVQLELQGSLGKPLNVYGQASDPLSTATLKKKLLAGASGGLILGAGLGFAYDMLRRRRQAQLDMPAADRPLDEWGWTVRPRHDDLAQEPRENGATPSVAWTRGGWREDA